MRGRIERREEQLEGREYRKKRGRGGQKELGGGWRRVGWREGGKHGGNGKGKRME